MQKNYIVNTGYEVYQISFRKFEIPESLGSLLKDQLNYLLFESLLNISNFNNFKFF